MAEFADRTSFCALCHLQYQRPSIWSKRMGPWLGALLANENGHHGNFHALAIKRFV